MIVEHIRELFNLENLSNSQILILKRFAILPSIEISFNGLIEMFGVVEVEEFENELQELIEKGWINEINSSFKIHQLIIEFVNLENRATYEEVKEIVEYFGTKLYKANEINPINGFKYIPFAKNILNLILEINEKIANLSNNLSTIYRDLGDLNNALEYIKKAIKIMESIFPNGHPNLDKVRENLKFIESKMGE